MYAKCVRPDLLSFFHFETLKSFPSKVDERRKDYNESKEKTALGLNSATYIHIKRLQLNENQINFPFSFGFWFV